jgi:hypothetical protein
MRPLTVSAHRSWLIWLTLAIVALTLLACGFEGGAFGSTPVPGAKIPIAAGQQPGQEPPLSGVTPGAAAVRAAPIDMPPGAPREGILITAPLPGQGVRGQMQIEGVAVTPDGVNPASQKLFVLVRDAQGTVVAASQPISQIDPSGKFSVSVAVPSNLPEQFGRAVIYSVPEGGAVISHLASVDVKLNGAAQTSAAPIDPNTLEAVTIVLPNSGAQLQGTARVSAITQLGPELVVEVRDADNQVVGRTQVSIDLTKVPSEIMAEVPLQVKQAGPGRVLVYALNARDKQTEHLGSVEVSLAP